MSSGRKIIYIHFNRIYFIITGIIILWIFLELRLFQIQIYHHEFYVEQSRIQSAKKVPLMASRGNIYDRNDECMATNLIHYDWGVDLTEVKNKNKIASVFAHRLTRSKSYYMNKMNQKRDFVYLARKVNQDHTESLDILDDPGLVKIEGYRRYYPFGKYGSQLIGFTDVDDKGVSGLELEFEKTLSGEDGWTYLMADALRRFGYNVDLPRSLPKPGTDIILTIDKNYQTIVEDELDIAVNKYNATYGMVVLMNPHTGEILAMYSSPGFDPNHPAQSTIDQRRNRVVTDIFEPGSTFKIFPAAALLQEEIQKPNDIVFCENGSFKYFDHTVNDSKKYGWLSFKKVIENSSNIGMVKLVSKLDKKTLYRYLKNFGFDSKTGINLIGETSGLLPKPDQFSGISKGVISFGQEIGVTALQITNAYAAVINGGYLMQPYVISRIVSKNRETIESFQTKRIRRVISSEVAEYLKLFMHDAVSRGTGKRAQIDGVEIGGKTGTAQKFDMKLKKYIRNSYLASFIGFAPYENPEFVLAIFLDSPKPRYYGGEVAAPVFATIMKRILNYSPGKSTGPSKELPVKMASLTIPDLQGLSVSSIEELLDSRDLSYSISGSGEYVIKQTLEEKKVNLVLGNRKINTSHLPDLRGVSIREALRKIDFSYYRVTVSGYGKVVSQSLSPGTHSEGFRVLHLICAE